EQLGVAGRWFQDLSPRLGDAYLAWPGRRLYGRTWSGLAPILLACHAPEPLRVVRASSPHHRRVHAVLPDRHFRAPCRRRSRATFANFRSIARASGVRPLRSSSVRSALRWRRIGTTVRAWLSVGPSSRGDS